MSQDVISEELAGEVELRLALMAAQKDIDEGHLSLAEPFFEELRKAYSLEPK